MAAKITNVKSKSLRYKLIGGGLLLLSFIIQNFVYDYWDKEADEYYNVNRDFSAMSRSGLLYLNLFYNTKTDSDELTKMLKEQYINMAAQKAALGQTVEITTRDIDKQERIDLANSLLQKAKNVKDLPGYLDYIAYSNQIDPYSLQTSANRVDKINSWRDTSRWIFLLAYIVGSAILLKGIKYE